MVIQFRCRFLLLGLVVALMASLVQLSAQQVDAAAEVFPNDPMAPKPSDPYAPSGNSWHLWAGPGGIRATRAWDQEWQVTAQENANGYVNGSRLVRFGNPDPAYNNWVYKQVTGAFTCSVSWFGSDPQPNVRKRCEVASSWTTLAREGQAFDLGAGAGWVRYGWADRYVYKYLTGKGTCDNEFFDRDPFYLTSKICQLQERPSGQGVVADEGDRFILTQETVVRFGTANNWVYKRFGPGLLLCAAGSFDNQDPAPNWYKHCEVVRSLGQDVTIAVLDGGITQHSDLNANVDVSAGYNFVENNRNVSDPGSRACGEANPKNWHGTQTASVAAAIAHNNRYIAGAAPFARILPLRVVDCSNATVMARLVRAILYAAGIPSQWPPGDPLWYPTNPRPARVIVMSFDAPGTCDSFLQQAINAARVMGVLVVAASGNAGKDLDTQPVMPASCSGVFTVGGSTQNGSFWPNANYGTAVQVSAPAVNVPILTNTGSIDPGQEAATFASGTSLAAPQVAAVAAMMWGINPKLSLDNVENRLRLSARNYAASCTRCGVGIVDADRALRSAQAITTKSPGNISPATADTLTAPADITATWDKNAADHYYAVYLPPGASLRVRASTDVPANDQWFCRVIAPGVPNSLDCGGTPVGYKNTGLNTQVVSIATGGRGVMIGHQYALLTTWDDGDI